MKKLLTLIACLALVMSLAACSKSKGLSDEDALASIDNIPVMVDRAILIDAVWALYEDLPMPEAMPESTACLAVSDLTFASDINPFVIATNNKSDPHFTTPVVITSPLNVTLTANEACSSEENVLLTATSDIPIDVEAIGENCPALGEIATPEGTAFPASGSLVAHIEAHEVDLYEHYCEQAGEAAPQSSPTDTGNPPETAPQSADDEVEEPGEGAEEPAEEEVIEEEEVVEEEVVEEEVVEEEVVEEEVVEEEVVEEECIDEECDKEMEEVIEDIVEEIVEEEGTPKAMSINASSSSKDTTNGMCDVGMPVKMFKLVIDQCTADSQEAEVVAE